MHDVFFFTLDLGHVSIMMIIVSPFLRGAHRHLETSLWIFFLEMLYALYIGVKHLSALKNVHQTSEVL